jgi:hypothetical protein
MLRATGAASVGDTLTIRSLGRILSFLLCVMIEPGRRKIRND